VASFGVCSSLAMATNPVRRQQWSPRWQDWRHSATLARLWGVRTPLTLHMGVQMHNCFRNVWQSLVNWTHTYPTTQCSIPKYLHTRNRNMTTKDGKIVRQPYSLSKIGKSQVSISRRLGSKGRVRRRDASKPQKAQMTTVCNLTGRQSTSSRTPRESEPPTWPTPTHPA
jgi:hypothetical protein